MRADFGEGRSQCGGSFKYRKCAFLFKKAPVKKRPSKKTNSQLNGLFIVSRVSFPCAAVIAVSFRFSTCSRLRTNMTEQTHMCQIQWIDANGKPTPDNNPAIGQVRTKARHEIICGNSVHFEASQPFYICAQHAKRLCERGMDIWEWCEPLPQLNHP